MKFAIALVAILSLVGVAAGDENTESRSVAVRVLAPPPTTAAGAAAASQPTMEPATSESTAVLPPQYRAGPPDETVGGDDDGVSEAAPLRFVLALPARAVLVEAKITVNGQPYQNVREERIDRLLEELTKSDAESNDAYETEDNSILGRLRRYALATQRSPSRNEIRWMMTHWMAGPTLLVLNENYQATRAGQSPLFRILDQDRDGSITEAERDASESRLLEYDHDQDEILSFEEIADAGKPTPAEARPQRRVPPPLIPLVELDAGSARSKLGLDDEAWLELSRREPDLQIVVAFDTEDPAGSRMEIVSPQIPAEQWTVRVHAGAAAFPMAGAMVEISAMQSTTGQAATGQAATGRNADQFSVGAVRDGFPLLPIVDQNQDGRLTLREMRQIADLIAPLDADRDGKLTAAEIPPTIRLAIAQGPVVHQPLAALRQLNPPATQPTVVAPEWFVRMDRNQDGDLTQGEFLGDPKLFASLDGDGDGLASAAEAARSDQNTSDQNTSDQNTSDQNTTESLPTQPLPSND